MTLFYTLDQNDFLIHQLFIASKSARIQKKRKRNRASLPIAYVAMALLFFVQGEKLVMILFLIVAICWIFLYPSWERKKYVKHYQQFIADCYKNRIGREASLTINNEYYLTKDEGGESKILTTETEEMVEIPDLILIRLKSGQSLIIPKTKIENIIEVRQTLKELALFLKISYHIDENWKWS